ncbi:MAG: GTP-binding protein [Chromatiales bacterium]|nr:GTP-binding protein [Chromatiales bacterium]
MLVKKVCMIGDFGVGKTSLVARFVHSVFSDKYLTTVGVKIDTKVVELPDGEAIKLVLWDIAGTSALSTTEQKYLRGAAAYLLVVDGTRAETLNSALALDSTAQQFLGGVPRILVINKHDLLDQWEISEQQRAELLSDDRPLALCSALSGEGVEQTFLQLADLLDRK